MKHVSSDPLSSSTERDTSEHSPHLKEGRREGGGGGGGGGGERGREREREGVAKERCSSLIHAQGCIYGLQKFMAKLNSQFLLFALTFTISNCCVIL